MTRNILQAMGVLFLGAAVLTAGAAERWIHVRVEKASGASGSMNINVPIQMASAVLPLIPTDQQHHGKFNLQASVNGMDIRAMLDAVGNSPDNVSATLEQHDKQVSVTKSGPNLLIKVVEKPTAEHHLGKTIAIKAPIAVVRALIAQNSDQVDIDGGIRALAREGDVDVTVNSEKETVRVWTDTRTTSD